MTANIQEWARGWAALRTDRAMTEQEIDAAARQELARLSLEQKAGQLYGTIRFLQIMSMGWNYGVEPYLMCHTPDSGIPSLYFTDGPRGATQHGSTCFPVSMARGATFDTDLEARVGDAIGVEARSHGSSFYAGVCINLLRHPGWGRAQETYSEDPFHMGEMGAALTRGAQRHLMACVKHYAGNSVDNTRFKVNVSMTERTLREVYLPHFRRCIVDEHAGSVMGAYNKLNGEQACHNKHLLRDILKGEWGFDGFVISDFVYGVKDGAAAVRGGLDVEMPHSKYYRHIPKMVRAGEIDEAQVDDAVLRVLRTKMRFAYIGEPERYARAAIGCDEHRALAREVAQKSIVLLQNRMVGEEAVLPLDSAVPGKVAVIGRLATAPNLGDKGSSQVRPEYVVTPLEGLEQALPAGSVVYDPGKRPARAAALAAQAQTAVVVVGYTDKDEGEYMIIKGGDRKSLRLPPRDVELVRAVAAANARTVVVLVGGSAIACNEWRAEVAAVVMAWYPGMEGGHALADILTGKVNPSGRMPCTVPVQESHLPPFDVGATEIEYGYYHGYRLLDRDNVTADFSFGFGLGYTTFSYANASVEGELHQRAGQLTLSVEVSNTGERAGETVVQCYTGCEAPRLERFVKELRGFSRVELAAGETRTVTFTIAPGDLAYYDPDAGECLVQAGPHRAWLGGSAAPEDLVSVGFDVAATPAS
ncbi:MAG: glycosyl hydrolase [Halioglobus sp.]|nr:glycosyl hydrolase [Halioglobus sp.]